MTNGWNESAGAWIASIGRDGDWGRRHVLDPVMLNRAKQATAETALDVGCGEGRFCRLLRAHGIRVTGIDLTRALLDQARKSDPDGDYRLGDAEHLEFDSDSFDLVVSYLTLIDINDFRAAIREMARVLRPGGILLVANLNSFFTSGFCESEGEKGWVTDEHGAKHHYAIDNYLDEFADWVEWDGIRIRNWHRPLAAYMQMFLDCGLQLSYFSEPEPVSGEAERRESYRRAPWFLVMEWRKLGVG